MILVSELGDETFIIAALLAMRNPKYIVFGGAMLALALMTVISTALGASIGAAYLCAARVNGLSALRPCTPAAIALSGVLAPMVISKEKVKSIATGLYIFFGLRLFYIAYKVRGGWLRALPVVPVPVPACC